jgi:hypothetical protein
MKRLAGVSIRSVDLNLLSIRVQVRGKRCLADGMAAHRAAVKALNHFPASDDKISGSLHVARIVCAAQQPAQKLAVRLIEPGRRLEAQILKKVGSNCSIPRALPSPPTGLELARHS